MPKLPFSSLSLSLTAQKDGNPSSARVAASKLKIPHVSASLVGAGEDLVISPFSGEVNAESIAKLVNDPSDVALFLHTSGTTSRPKGVPLTQLNHGVQQQVGASGKVCVRGPNVTRGYKNNPEANRTAFKFGWFHTGDIGYFDSDGYLHLVGRIKELINRGGSCLNASHKPIFR